MIVRDFPRSLVLLMNLAVVAVLVVFACFLRWTGTEFCVGLIVGFLACYSLFRCWRFDYDATESPEPLHPPRQQRSVDRAP
jgi:hypothetical protein